MKRVIKWQATIFTSISVINLQQNICRLPTTLASALFASDGLATQSLVKLFTYLYAAPHARIGSFLIGIFSCSKKFRDSLNYNKLFLWKLKSYVRPLTTKFCLFLWSYNSYHHGKFSLKAIDSNRHTYPLVFNLKMQKISCEKGLPNSKLALLIQVLYLAGGLRANQNKPALPFTLT